MKIGIITFHNADNYGAVLQTYGLQEALRNLGHTVEIININHKFLRNRQDIICINTSSLYRMLRSSLSSVFYLHSRISKKLRFLSFRNKYLQLSKKVKNTKNLKYDAYITGSDQVWNVRMTNFDKNFFLDFCSKGEKTLSYAASLGSCNLSPEGLDFIKSQISNINNISVREASAKILIGTLTNKIVNHVLDPTLLHKSDMWYNLTKNFKEDTYILVYSVGPIGDLLSITEDVYKRTGTPIYLLPPLKHKKFKTIRHVSPQEFLSLISSATMIITNSFHGTIFSILFNKKFISIPHLETGDRVRGLLIDLGLEHRIVEDTKDAFQIITKDIDYDLVQKRLDNRRNESYQFLINSLGNLYDK